MNAHTERINKLISESGLSKKHIAEKLDITYDTLRRKLNGQKDFKVNELVTLCNILNIKIMEVFENE